MFVQFCSVVPWIMKTIEDPLPKADDMKHLCTYERTLEMTKPGVNSFK